MWKIDFCSKLYAAAKEKEFVVWIAQRDQSIIGGGTVGFRIDEMPWSIENFSDDKEFLFSVIDNAILKHWWSALSYTPNEERITRCLTHFRSLVSEFQKKNVDNSHYLYWSSTDDIDNTPTIPLDFIKCEKHLIYLSCHGCIICNS